MTFPPPLLPIYPYTRTPTHTHNQPNQLEPEPEPISTTKTTRREKTDNKRAVSKHPRMIAGTEQTSKRPDRNEPDR